MPTRVNGRPGVVIIAEPNDRLARLVAVLLSYDDIPVWALAPRQLGEVKFELHAGLARIDGHPIGGLLLRVSPCLDLAGDEPMRVRLAGDTSLVDARLATWLAVASLASVRAINGYDSEAWRKGAGWSVWARRLAEAHVPVRSSSAPRHLRPGEVQTSLVVCGQVVVGSESEAVRGATEVLEASGVRLATVSTLPDGRVAAVDTQPDLADGPSVRRAAARIADFVVAA